MIFSPFTKQFSKMPKELKDTKEEINLLKNIVNQLVQNSSILKGGRFV